MTPNTVNQTRHAVMALVRVRVSLNTAVLHNIKWPPVYDQQFKPSI